ncbi:MAG: protein disulfide-isomerase [Cenarchaeum symbiont of Oopsacas minuta]|nr:protein disulfide-isomerase [Cenarchaeum symbiont of Oopsacas minuta]
MIIHGPSLTIGATVAVAIMLIAFIALNDAEMPLNSIDVPPAKIDVATLVENGSPRLGDEKAPVTIIEFGDYQCFFCNKFYHDTEKRLISEFVDTGKVSIIFKDFIIIGQDSVNAAIGARCATEQEMFWEYHDILYENWDGENTGWASMTHLKEFAIDIGLNEQEWLDCVQSNRHVKSLDASNNDAIAVGLSGTPAFFIIGSDNSVVALSGAQPYEVFERIINEQL